MRASRLRGVKQLCRACQLFQIAGRVYLCALRPTGEQQDGAKWKGGECGSGKQQAGESW